MKHIKTLLTAIIIGFSLLSFTAFNKNNEEPKQKVNSSKGYEVGDTAADFKLKNIDGKMVSLSDFKKAKGFIVVFTCNHCPYAKKYEDRIVALDKKYKEAGYPVIAINPNDPNVQPEDGFQQMITRAKEKGFTFPYLVDEGQKVYPQYGATKTPHVFILQKEGKKNIVKYIGAIDNNYDDPNDVSEHYVEDAMDALLSGKAVANTKTVAIGCTIKVKK
ncbi:thioredoxin family protein [Chryseobacterium sp. NKUCC03_KSP]|uniref:thioredoxin family protein n=1 Tax=Chryseobacterium sp. NKUCC03_KSP TaxID=2842125 RepID=UPI001C5A6DFD|nr:thioredoxin family protein [Chryseobacterium sp. NKUCC03_KSP]MBW3520534.1 thioredoxin family protein [Chryseobacterium sp. NKUCC03_KSP]